MVELQIVILAVAGSSPVGHPPSASRREVPNSKFQAPSLHPSEIQARRLGFGFWDLKFSPPPRVAAVACALLNTHSMLNPAVLESGNSKEVGADFWLRLFNDAELTHYGDLEKIVIGCEIIAALDSVELLAA
jgi:hypothetical protein